VAGQGNREKALLDELLPQAFAVVREAGKRVLGMRHFDVQLIGGMVLHAGQIAEMKTGEGKTLVATLPAYLNALTGRGVHVVTVNDYLARRDAEWMGQVHRFLGLSVGLIQQEMSPAERRRNYGCDITYATNSELGFDYLRDNMANDIAEVVQRDFHYCVIDEVDSILIDEARTPLIISGQVERPQEKYQRAVEVANQLVRSAEIGKDGILRFFGTLSLENNGGFSSLRSKRIEMDLSDAEGLVLRVKGDGRSYQVRLSTDAEFRGGEVSFQAEFATKKDEWIEVQVPFKNLAGSWRGMKLPDKTFDAAKVRRVGLLLGDKKQGPFALQVDWIRTYGAVSKASE
jgi:hypothetical protein